MEYRSILYGNAPQSSLLLIEGIQNYGIRLSLSATKSITIPAQQYGSKVPPLFIRRALLTKQYVLKALAKHKASAQQPYLVIHNTQRFFKSPPPLISVIAKERSQCQNKLYSSERDLAPRSIQPTS